MPTIWIISRHPGALEWLKNREIEGRHLEHLEADYVKQGDTVIGTLPINLAAQVCAKGAVYWHLSLSVPFKWRGCELSLEQMEACGATLIAYHVYNT